jgi:hypothetical protein
VGRRSRAGRDRARPSARVAWARWRSDRAGMQRKGKGVEGREGAGLGPCGSKRWGGRRWLGLNGPVQAALGFHFLFSFIYIQ